MKAFLWIIGILGGLAIILFIAAFVVVKLAFGPLHSDGEIDISENLYVDYHEVYSADMASWWYDVKYSINAKEIFNTSFKNENWLDDTDVYHTDTTSVLVLPDTGEVHLLIFDKSDSFLRSETYPISSLQLIK